jgi:hypothetical protein
MAMGVLRKVIHNLLHCKNKGSMYTKFKILNALSVWSLAYLLDVTQKWQKRKEKGRDP